ncbi:hypothetical protein [Phascolarctobacterium succinatutens]|jgi:hypothetical protein|uniref:hypothetical protein n=1 Tax=Phascolarctobacterium succinatutens TaxID=626940 RepID=UPI003AB5C22A
MDDDNNVKEPKCNYYVDSTLQDSLEWWKKVLHLQNWCIKAVLTDEKLEVDGRAVHGRNTTEYLKCESFIEISTVEYAGEYTKHCEELTLVHELLHCAMPLFCNDDDSATMRDAWVELLEHQRIDMLAKSLIMAKYGVGIEWFMK